MKIFFNITILLVFININYVVGQVYINNADNLFYNMNLNEALDSYQKIYKNNNANVEDRALAGRKLAYISWHFNNDLDSAREIIKNSLKFKSYAVYLYSDLIHYESQANNFNNAKEVYQEALLNITSENKINLINIAYSNFVIEESIYKIKNRQPIDTLLIHDALNKIIIANKVNPGILKSAKIQLGLALLLKNGKEALNAWNLYFNTSTKQKATRLLTKVATPRFI